MARSKRTSAALEQARARAAGLASISPTLDLGAPRTLAGLNNKIANLQAKLDAYNNLLATADQALDEIEGLEKELAEASNLMLLAVAARYGKDGREYEAAGGVRTSERKKPTRRTEKDKG